MNFELDAQMVLEPPHWKDSGTWLGPRAWLTGQAVALREISWNLTKKPGDAELQPRWQALAWLLRKTDNGAKILSEGAAAGEMQAASDRPACLMPKATPWTTAVLFASVNMNFFGEINRAGRARCRRHPSAISPGCARRDSVVKARPAFPGGSNGPAASRSRKSHAARRCRLPCLRDEIP